MRLTVIGCGYLGAVHAAAMADLGHHVLGVETDPARLALVHVFRPGAGAWLAAWTHLALNSTTTLGWRAE